MQLQTTMKDINCLTISGTIAQRPTCFATKTGFRVVRFRLKISRTLNVRGDDGAAVPKDIPVYVTVKVIGQKSVDRAMLLDVGQRIVCAGHLAYDIYQGADGQQKEKVVVEVVRAIPIQEGEEG